MDYKDPANWHAISFSLLDKDDNILATLPPTTAFNMPLGKEVFYEWDRAPFSTVFYPLGDGLAKEPPKCLLKGDWKYPTREKALEEIQKVADACTKAKKLTWCAQFLAQLREDIPAIYTVNTGQKFAHITHNLNAFLVSEIDLNKLFDPTLPTITYPNIGGAYGGGTWRTDANGNVIIGGLFKI